jgi:hypothetical protein
MRVLLRTVSRRCLSAGGHMPSTGLMLLLCAGMLAAGRPVAADKNLVLACDCDGDHRDDLQVWVDTRHPSGHAGASYIRCDDPNVRGLPQSYAPEVLAELRSKVADRCGTCAKLLFFCKACKGDEGRRRDPAGNSLAPGDPMYDTLVNAVRAAGVAGFGPEHIAVQDDRANGGLIKWQIRVAADGCFLPATDCLRWAAGEGYPPESKQETGTQLLVGSIQFAGAEVRVNGRFVDVETSLIGRTGKGTSSGTDAAAVERAMSAALAELALECKKARGLSL